AYTRAHGGAPGTRATPRPAIPGNADPTPQRVVHVVACPPATFRRGPFSVTTLALTAVGVATERFLAEFGLPAPDTLNSLVPMALPEDVPWPAANRIVNGTVDLHLEITDLAQRAEAIRLSLKAARRDVVDPHLLRWITAENRVPAPVFLAATRFQRSRAAVSHAVPQSVQSNLTVVSVDRGDAELTLCGARALFTAGFPMLSAARSVSHGFYGLGDTLTVCIIACPDTFPAHARYADIVEQAVRDVAAATATRG
ncbi:MAG: WS/DGAT domain-containing protein, partial [Rhodococcus sp. (in: high G+C Gram-positive bacteria)]